MALPLSYGNVCCLHCSWMNITLAWNSPCQVFGFFNYLSQGKTQQNDFRDMWTKTTKEYLFCLDPKYRNYMMSLGFQASIWLCTMNLCRGSDFFYSCENPELWVYEIPHLSRCWELKVWSPIDFVYISTLLTSTAGAEQVFIAVILDC